MSVSPHTEHEQLENKLEVGVEETLCHTDLYSEEAPLLLVIEHVDQGDDDELQGESTHRNYRQGNEEEYHHPLSVVEGTVSLSEIVIESEEKEKGPEYSRCEGED